MRVGISLGQPASLPWAALHSPGMGLTPLGKPMAAALWPQWPQVLLPQNHLPSPVLPVNHSRPCPCPRQPCRERAVLDMYIKRRIKPGPSIAPDLWLHQPWEGGRNFFPFLIPPQHSFPGLPCCSSLPGCWFSAVGASLGDPSSQPSVPSTPKPEQGAVTPASVLSLSLHTG